MNNYHTEFDKKKEEKIAIIEAAGFPHDAIILSKVVRNWTRLTEMILAVLLKELRLKAALTLTEMAKACDVSVGIYSKKEKGKSGIFVDNLCLACHKHNVDTNDILGIAERIERVILTDRSVPADMMRYNWFIARAVQYYDTPGFKRRKKAELSKPSKIGFKPIKTIEDFPEPIRYVYDDYFKCINTIENPEKIKQWY